MDKVEVLTPPVMKSWMEYQELRAVYEKFALVNGVDLQPERTWRSIFLFSFYQFVLNVGSDIGVPSLVHEYKHGRVNFANICQTMIIVVGSLFIDYSIVFLFAYHDRLTGLLEYCAKLSKTEGFDETFLLKTTRLLYRLGFIIPIWDATAAIMVSLVRWEHHTPIPMHYPQELMDDFKYYVLLFIWQLFFNFAFWQIILFLVCTYIILVQHIQAQYQALGRKLRELTDAAQLKKANAKGSDVEFSKQLDTIGREHAELLQIIGDTNKIFEFSLIINEFFAIVCITIALITFQYEQEETVFACQCVLLFSIYLIYPYLGQEITTTAEDFADAGIECNWVDLSVVNKKKLGLIVMMAQQPVGLSSGGFHYSNYLEMSQVCYEARRDNFS